MTYAYDEMWVPYPPNSPVRHVLDPHKLPDLATQRTFFEQVGILFGRGYDHNGGLEIPRVAFHDKTELDYVARGLREGKDYTTEDANVQDGCPGIRMVVHNPALREAFKADPTIAKDPEHRRALLRGLISDSVLRSAHDEKYKPGHRLVLWETENWYVHEAVDFLLSAEGGIPYTPTVTPASLEPKEARQLMRRAERRPDKYRVWPPPDQMLAVIFLEPAILKKYVIAESPFSDAAQRLDGLTPHLDPLGTQLMFLRQFEYRTNRNKRVGRRLGLIDTTEKALEQEHERLRAEIRRLTDKKGEIEKEVRTLARYEDPAAFNAELERTNQRYQTLEQELAELTDTLFPQDEGSEEGKPRRRSRGSYAHAQARKNLRDGNL